MEKGEKFVLKAFNLSPFEIVLHSLTAERFNRTIENVLFQIQGGKVRVKILDVFHFGIYNFGAKQVPFIVQDYAGGPVVNKTLDSSTPILAIDIHSIFKELSKKKYTLDPFPSNWRRSLVDEDVIEYIDLIFSGDEAVKEASRDLIKSKEWMMLEI